MHRSSLILPPFFSVLDNVVMTLPHFNIFLYSIESTTSAVAKWCCTLFII